MGHAKRITVRGAVVELLPNANSTVALADERKVRATLSGKLRTRSVRVAVGDTVTVELSPFDPTRGNVVGWERNPGSGRSLPGAPPGPS